MPKELIGEPNEWAWDFYRMVEDYVYHVMSLDTFRNDLMLRLGIPNDVREYLIDRMTNPPAIDYTE